MDKDKRTVGLEDIFQEPSESQKEAMKRYIDLIKNMPSDEEIRADMEGFRLYMAQKQLDQAWRDRMDQLEARLSRLEAIFFREVEEDQGENKNE